MSTPNKSRAWEPTDTPGIYRVPGRKGDRYLARMNVGQGSRPYSKTFRRKIDAEVWLKEQMLLYKTGDSPISENKKKTVRQLAELWLTSHAEVKKQFSSLERDRSFLKNQIFPAFGARRIDVLTSVQIEQWLGTMRREGLAPKTCNNCLGLLKTILSYGAKRLGMPNPARDVAPIKLPEQDYAYWTENEIDTALRFVAEHASEKLPAIMVAVYTGMRDGEIWGLRWDCVDLEKRQITVKRSFCVKSRKLKETTKGKRIRRIPIHPKLIDLLAELKNTTTDGEQVISGFDFSHAARTMRTIAKRAGVRSITYHDLRHTFATMYMRQGGSIYTLQALLGHTSIKMTERYAHHKPGYGADAIDFLNYSGESNAKAKK